MAQRSSYELLGILKRMNNLPSKDVKQSLDNLGMRFSDWANLTNERLAGFDARDFSSKQLQMYEDKVNITYEQYLEIKAKCKRFMELSDDSNRAKVARGRRQYFLKDIQDGKYTEEELGVMSEDEVSTLEEIEELWEDVRAKYDPVQEVIRSAQKAKDMFEYGTSSDKLPFSIAEVKRNISQLKKATRYLDESKILDDKCLEFEDVLTKAMQDGLRSLETLKSSGDLSVDEFITELGLDKEEVNSYFTKRMEKAKLGKSDAPSIMARDGKGFRINENGELEIIDEGKAKDLIADAFVADKVLDEPIEVLDRAEKYSTLTHFLDNRPAYSVGTKEVETLIEEVSNFGETAIADWMIENPNKFSAMRSALEEKGIKVDINTLMHDLSDELQNPYEDPDYGFDEERLAKIAKFLDRMNYPSYEEEYVEENDDLDIDQFGESIIPDASQTTKPKATEIDEELIQWLNSGSEKTVPELMQKVADNNKKIADNEKTIKQALVDKLISQQETIDAQQEEIAQLRGEKINEK